jgi:hypothetical protein
VSWSREFDRPIALPDGRQIVTLSDARDYLIGLPKARHSSEPVQTAIEAVMMAAEGRGPLMHAHIGMSQAINGTAGRPEPKPGAKDPHWGRRKVARDR